jgi:hypothetical protein
VAGVTAAAASSWLVGSATDSVVIAAYGAAFGEAVGFYGSFVLREMVGDAYAAGARRAPYGMPQMARTWRGLFLEFGPSELLDAALVRPLAMGIGRHLFGWGWGVLAGKLLADMVFYVPVIWIHERRQRAA